ncbi:hypothetical protein BWQ96_04240 [Gracilariopsis chorda]|uniref:Uncharacterized protein n=1 Tax=Gracilariopsis chorda TaxID=448386 RepID=A0A2V3IV32_9FLOR|nr:hypothetical protein BWQ96_04240 [Gracilariopsis chorda]|eukprot:PXF45984.1 hypothetical protein BWQ96_04240 [Gracilariopsis chorda]
MEKAFTAEGFQALATALCSVIDRKMGTLQAVILSFGDWSDADDDTVTHVTDNIRTFICCDQMSCLEVRVRDFTIWDSINYEQALFWRLSAKVLVFRFRDIQELRELIQFSVALTHTFIGLEHDRERVLKPHVENIVKILNRRFEVEEVVAESKQLVRFVNRIRTPASYLKVFSLPVNEIFISRGDSLEAFGPMRRRGRMTMSEYGGLESIGEMSDVKVRMSMLLTNVAEGLYRLSFFSEVMGGV